MMSPSSTLRVLSWAMAMALAGAASVVHAGPCQEEYGKETKKIDADHEQDVKNCHGPGSAPCIKKANAKKAAGLKEAGDKQRTCNKQQIAEPELKALVPTLDQSDPRLVRPTTPNQWSQQGPDLVWTDSKGRPWTFKPTTTDYEGRKFTLDKNSVRVWQHETKGEIVSATYRYRNPMVAPDHEEHITVDGKGVPDY